MLRSRAGHSLVFLRRGINTQWTRASNKRPETDTTHLTQDGANRMTEEDNVLKALLRDSPDSALIRSWSFPKSMKDVFAIIRTVERKYGPVREFKIFRDFEVPTSYQGVIRVAFRNPESQKRIPEKSEELQIVLPPEPSQEQPGGISMAELEEYLATKESPINLTSTSNAHSVPTLDNVMADVIEDNQANAESINSERVITCRVGRLASSLYTPSHVAHYWPPRNERDAISRHLLNWGGFREFSPLEKGYPLPDTDFFKGSKVEHFRMRHSLRRASRQIEVPNPYEISSEQLTSSVPTTGGAPELEWEPLSTPKAEEKEFDPITATLGDMQEVEKVPSDASTSEGPTSHTTSLTESTNTILDETSASTSPLQPPSPSDMLAPTPELSLSVSPPSATSSDRDSQLKEQLREARFLARQVVKERKRHEPEPIPLAEKDSVKHVEESLLEHDTSEEARTLNQLEGPPSPDSSARSEQVNDPWQENKGMMKKFKNALGGLF
ncbi:hypothetical protein AX15_006832 [Amanita polypyramis BW_CC]|nr:hypothetical protein AX15_006832 [Amanita polypyramis BW_CC]